MLLLPSIKSPNSSIRTISCLDTNMLYLMQICVVVCSIKPLLTFKSLIYTKCPSSDKKKGIITLGQKDSLNECVTACIDKPWCAGIVHNIHIHLCVGLPNDILARIDVQQHEAGHPYTQRYSCVLIKKTSLQSEMKQVSCFSLLIFGKSALERMI